MRQLPKPIMRIGQGWEAAVCPLGGLQSAAHRRWCEACWTPTTSVIKSSGPITKVQALSVKLKFSVWALGPLSFSLPRRSGTTGIQAKIWSEVSKIAFLVDFFAFRTALEKWHRKNIEKNAKIEDFGLPKPSQNLSKMPSKSKFQKTSIFSKYLIIFFAFVLSSKP